MVDADGLDVGGDVSIAAGDVDFKGHVAGEVSIAGGDVTWDGEAGDEFSIASGDLAVRGRIAGEASLAAGDMDLDAVFLDGLTAQAGAMSVAGEIHGDLKLVAIDEMRRNREYRGEEGRIEIGARVHDGARICAIEVRFTSSARIDGRVEVYAEHEPEIERGARIDNLVYTPRERRDCDDLIDD